MRHLGIILLLFGLCGAGAARAAVVDSSAAGFLVRHEVVVHAAPAVVYRALVGRIGEWWDPEHTFSHDARNLTLEAKPGGCLCERLPDGGGVQHLTVVYVRPNRALRLLGPMGPLQATGAAGSMTWDLAAEGAATKVVLSYSVGGYLPGGLQAMAGPVDSVLGELLRRLARLVETGSPVAK